MALLLLGQDRFQSVEDPKLSHAAPFDNASREVLTGSLHPQLPWSQPRSTLGRKGHARSQRAFLSRQLVYRFQVIPIDQKQDKPGNLV